MIYKEKIGNELYVWMNGKLLYKRWLNYGYGKIFDRFGAPFSAKDVEGRKKSANNKKK